jgi:hypothetical protein
LALVAGIEGPVNIECHVAADGSVTEAKALSGHPLLAKPVEENVRRWTFDTSGHEVNALSTKILYRFVIDHKGESVPSEFVFEEPNIVTVVASAVPVNPNHAHH